MGVYEKLTRLSSCLFLNSTLFHILFRVCRMSWGGVFIKKNPPHERADFVLLWREKKMKEMNLFGRGIWNRDLGIKG